MRCATFPPLAAIRSSFSFGISANPRSFGSDIDSSPQDFRPIGEPIIRRAKAPQRWLGWVCCEAIKAKRNQSA
jgi:hypothetical protein